MNSSKNSIDIEFLSEKKPNKHNDTKDSSIISNESLNCSNSSSIKRAKFSTDEDASSSLNDHDDNDDDDKGEEDKDIPNGAECLARCKEFAEITGTDTALAMFYLQDTRWDLQRGLDAYFQSTKESGSKVVACFDVEKLNEDEKIHSKKQNSRNTYSNKRSKNHQESPDQLVARSSNEDKEEENEDEDEEEEEAAYKAEKTGTASSYPTKINTNEAVNESEDKHFKILSWNIDGLDSAALEKRTYGVINTILKEKPDVCLFQEVVASSEHILKINLTNYNIITGRVESSSPVYKYYVAIAIRKNTCSLKSNNLIQFENSVMGRNLLELKLVYKNLVNMSVMTTHLESTADYSKSRIDQLKKCFKLIQEQDPSLIVIFGGDLNLRDTELAAIGGLPNGIYDLWQSTGSRKECLYTWDCMRNSNLTMNGKFKPRCRFDRLYFRQAREKDNQIVVNNQDKLTLTPVYFELEGLEKLKNCGRFCSDHWAIQSYFQFN